jgi:hypothetical protein
MQPKIDEVLASVRNITTPLVAAVLETHAEAKQRVTDFSVHVGITANADTVLLVAGTSLSLVVVLLSCLYRLIVHVRQRNRDRSNRLVVEAAAAAPLDDRDEHELEQRGGLRMAAPGDSDMDEDHFALPGVPEKER